MSHDSRLGFNTNIVHAGFQRQDQLGAATYLHNTSFSHSMKIRSDFKGRGRIFVFK